MGQGFQEFGIYSIGYFFSLVKIIVFIDFIVALKSLRLKELNTERYNFNCAVPVMIFQVSQPTPSTFGAK